MPFRRRASFIDSTPESLSGWVEELGGCAVKGSMRPWLQPSFAGAEAPPPITLCMIASENKFFLSKKGKAWPLHVNSSWILHQLVWTDSCALAKLWFGFYFIDLPVQTALAFHWLTREHACFWLVHHWRHWSAKCIRSPNPTQTNPRDCLMAPIHP